MLNDVKTIIGFNLVDKNKNIVRTIMVEKDHTIKSGSASNYESFFKNNNKLYNRFKTFNRNR